MKDDANASSIKKKYYKMSLQLHPVRPSSPSLPVLVPAAATLKTTSQPHLLGTKGCQQASLQVIFSTQAMHHLNTYQPHLCERRTKTRIQKRSSSSRGWRRPMRCAATDALLLPPSKPSEPTSLRCSTSSTPYHHSCFSAPPLERHCQQMMPAKEGVCLQK